MSIADSKTEHSSLPSITSASSKVADVIVAAPEKPSQSGKMDDHSLLNSLTTEEIELHLASLHKAVQLPPAKLKAKCGEVLKGLQSHNHGWVFNTPVDPVELGLPDYFEIIKKPMDLGTVSKKLDNGAYHFITEFAADVKLTFDNAMTYNEEGSVVHDMAKELMIKFLADYKKLMAQLEAEDREARRNDRACTLCGCEKLLFEPPVFFCNGMNCQSKRIRRNSHFYVGGNGQYFWCNQCHNELDGSIPIELGDISIMKNDLKKKKNDEVHEESWVQCDECESWIHQICGLFNTRQNKEHHSKYFCPKCLIRRRKSGVPPSPRPPSAADLPRTKLSEYLERHIHCKVAEKKAQLVQDRGDSEKAPMSKALKALECGDIIIRQVTATDRKLEVRELMKKRYAHKNYPEEFPFRCKCIVVFQKIDGVDVILFALYVYEHGSDNPPPNRRCVYISYLDSVHFMRPRRLRTYVYHELLVCYLDYARQKGFSTAHIWACPPLKGDDYIFYCKPEDQKTPRDARLRQWYIEMLTECQRRNICGKVTNMYDLYIADETLDATALPYLEGDYFPGEAENIIKELEEGGCKKGSTGGKKSKKKSSKSKGRGSRPDDDSPWGEEPTSPKGFLEGGRDDVMVKLGETIHPMKDSFIVAFLNWSGAREEDMKVPDEIVEYRQESESTGIAEQERINRKRDSQGNAKDDGGSTEKVIDDDDEDMDCEFLNNRQAFLNLCRGNHYQFDELRRAKHTSMMVLWHLHNRDAPKFVQQCAACSREILSGTRYHCNVCPDYDLCEDCFRNPNTIRGSCKHNLIPMAVENNSEGQGGGTSGLTEEQRRERQRNLQLHIQLIEHASRCISSSCNSSNCAKMKTYLQHGRTCKLKASGGCKICKRIWTLLRIHAQKCKDAVCPIPQCMAIRERLRQLAKQQQAMDDRRRQEMNRAFRMSLVANQGG
jgi:E1A/CREB-binding protein